METIKVARKAVDVTVFTYLIFSFSLAAPIIGAIAAEGVAFLDMPYWVFGAAGGFLAAAGLAYKFCDTESRKMLQRVAPICFFFVVLALPVYFVTGFSIGADAGRISPLRNLLPLAGKASLWISLFAMPLFFWLAAVAGLVTTIKAKSDQKQASV